MVSQPYKDLIADGAWARDAETTGDNPDRQTPEDAGLDRSQGWPLAYEQVGSDKTPSVRCSTRVTSRSTPA